MAEQPKPEAGQIWKENDPRMERFIRVIGVAHGGSIMIRTCDRAGNFAKAPMRQAQAFRFDGRRGGYAIWTGV